MDAARWRLCRIWSRGEGGGVNIVAADGPNMNQSSDSPQNLVMLSVSCPRKSSASTPSFPRTNERRSWSSSLEPVSKSRAIPVLIYWLLISSGLWWMLRGASNSRKLCKSSHYVSLFYTNLVILKAVSTRLQEYNLPWKKLEREKGNRERKRQHQIVEPWGNEIKHVHS